MTEQSWRTSITKVEPNKLTVRGYRLDELIGRLSFAEMVYLILKGEVPAPAVANVMDAIMVSSVDHGPTPPSTLAARTVASTGASFNAALAAGVLSINRHHGGAIEGCMHVLQRAVDQKRAGGQDAGEAAVSVVRTARQEGRRLPGYGHRVHTHDPRTARLFQVAREAGVAGEYVEMALAIQDAMARETGKELPLNVDGAIAALLCEMEFPTELANAVFIMARIAGLTAHVFEEISTQKPMRQVSPTAHQYVGPEGRKLDGR
ncbi:citrate synthase [Clostridiales bacterium PH28_bin88]|nr:citrate synthase [Clostridiales bacterium PH28_bin88]